MKKLLLLALLTVSGSAFAQNVGIGTNKPDESAILDLKSSNKGFLLPRLTEKQKGLIPQPAEGLMIYQTDSNQGVYLFQGGNWKNIGNTNVTTTGTTANATTAYTANYLLVGDGTSTPVSSSIYVNPSNGNVGIGVNNSNSKLYVAGDMYSTANITSRGGLQLGDAILNSPQDVVFYSNISAAPSSYGKFVWYNRNWDGFTKAIIGAETDNAISDAKLVFKLGKSGENASTKMTIRSSGNVGIGLDVPTYKLHVNGNSYINDQLVANGGIQIDNRNSNSPKSVSFESNISTFPSTYGSFDWYNRNWDAFTKGSIGVETDNAISDGKLVFKTGAAGGNATTKMTIRSTGSVGIGTTTPYYLLHVNGIGYFEKIMANTGIQVDNRGLNSPKNIEFESNSNNLSVGLGNINWYNRQWDALIKAAVSAELDGAVSSGKLVFKTGVSGSDATTKMTISSNGNIGIGTSSPSQKLDVSGSIKQSAVTSSLIKADGTGKLVAATAGTDFVSSGTNTVGTIAKFTAAGTVANSALTEAAITNGTGVKVDSKSAGYLAVGDFGAGTPMSIPSGYRLVVQDGIITEKVKVAVRNQTDWADYVFEPNYSLMPLNEVEQFVKENKHLPNVPSAEEMVEKGVEVGQTSKMFMEKIEELTLYMIELKKEIEALKAENAKLRK